MYIFVCRYIEAGTLMNNYAHIFDLLTRLRQVSGIYSFFGSTNQPMHFFDDIDILVCDLFALQFVPGR